MTANALRTLLLILPFAAWLILPVQAAEPTPAGGAPHPPTISVEAEGKVLARPDMAALVIEVETQAPQAAEAARENAGRTDHLLAALKKVAGPEDQIKTLGFRLTPVYAPKDKNQPPVIKAYRAVNRLQLLLKEVSRLGPAIDAAWKNGASQINGPDWEHSRLEELQREAAVNALEKARRLAEALAQAAGLKIQGVERLSTGIRPIPWRGASRDVYMAAAPAPPPTPIEVGEEEIRANVQAVFRLGP